MFWCWLYDLCEVSEWDVCGVCTVITFVMRDPYYGYYNFPDGMRWSMGVEE